tara:strand:- start:62 stop:523 length:462 start_codon:yes stop_codon:yes gene_type:complete
MSDDKIIIPQGTVIDKENSNLDTGDIMFKKVSPEVDYDIIEGWIVDVDSEVCRVRRSTRFSDNRNSMHVFPTREGAESVLNLSLLLQLRRKIVKLWEPNWEDKSNKYTIIRKGNRLLVTVTKHRFAELSFDKKISAVYFLDENKAHIRAYFRI